MRNKYFCLLICLLLCLSFCFGGLSVSASGRGGAERAEALIDGIIGYNLKNCGAQSVQEWMDGALCENAGVSSEWYIIALSQSGEYDMSQYERSLISYISQSRVHAASTQQKYALALSASGSIDGYISHVAESTVGKQGIMSLIFGLHLLNNGYNCEGYTADGIALQIVSLEKADGGWALMGNSSDVDVTAMVLQALAPHVSSNSDVGEAVDRALSFLSAVQRDDGSYISNLGASNAESVSQVIVALSDLGIDCFEDERFIKNGRGLFDALESFALEDGGISHTVGGNADHNATSQALCAAVAYLRMHNGESDLYLLDCADPENVCSPDSHADTKPVDTEENASALGDSSDESGINIKLWICIAIGVIGGAVCAVGLIRKRIRLMGAAIILGACGLAIGLVLSVNIRSVDDYYSQLESKEAVGRVSITVRCDTVAGREEHIPRDGVIIERMELDIAEGDTAYDILIEAARAKRVTVENDGGDGIAYISGIGNLYEFDFGDLSGWMFFVNGQSLSVGCGEYVLRDGDSIEWHYSCDMGEDINK